MDPRDEGVTVSLVMLASFCVGGEASHISSQAPKFGEWTGWSAYGLVFSRPDPRSQFLQVCFVWLNSIETQE